MSSDEHITQTLIESTRGDERAAERLMLLMHDKLRVLAGQYMARERVEHTLQPTALLNEAYLRMFNQSRLNWQNKAHFVASAAQIMRRILVDHARQHAAAKRGGDRERVELDEPNLASPMVPTYVGIDLIALDDALEELKLLNPRQARVVELRFFGGLTVKEAAYALDIAERTANNDWEFARAWLRQRISQCAGK